MFRKLFLYEPEHTVEFSNLQIDILLKPAELGTIDILPLERQGYYFIGLNGIDFNSWH